MVCVSVFVGYTGEAPTKTGELIEMSFGELCIRRGCTLTASTITLNNSCAAAMQLYGILNYFDHLLSLLLLSDDCFSQLFNVEARVPVGV